MKKTKLTKLEEFFIENSDLTPEEIAKELDRSDEQINEHLNKEETKIRVEERIKKYFSIQTKNNRSGVVVASETTSDMVDRSTKLHKQILTDTSCIHKIK